MGGVRSVRLGALSLRRAVATVRAPCGLRRFRDREAGLFLLRKGTPL